jgi:hypothetical protein
VILAQCRTAGRRLVAAPRGENSRFPVSAAATKESA